MPEEPELKRFSRAKFIKAFFLSSAFFTYACKARNFTLNANNNSQLTTSNHMTSKIELPQLPYARNALAPHISEKIGRAHV